jgi:hypothetical protein
MALSLYHYSFLNIFHLVFILCFLAVTPVVRSYAKTGKAAIVSSCVMTESGSRIIDGNISEISTAFLSFNVNHQII